MHGLIATPTAWSVGGISKGDLLWEQNETGSEGKFPEDIGQAVFGWFGRGGNDPELTERMVDDGDGLAEGRAHGPTAAEEIDLVIGVASACEMEGEVKVQQAGVWAWTHGIAFLREGADLSSPSTPSTEPRGGMAGFARPSCRPTVSRSIPSSRAIRRRDHPFNANVLIASQVLTQR